MNFYPKKRRLPSVPIVTLIDILAILLIFFIVTTTFKSRQSLVKVNLPRSSQLASGEPNEKRFILSLGKDGRIALGERVVPMEQLAAELQRFRTNPQNGKLELRADEGAPLGALVGVWDAAVEAGVEIADLPLRILLRDP